MTDELKIIWEKFSYGDWHDIMPRPTARESLAHDYGLWCAIDGAWRASQYTSKSPALFAKWFEQHWGITPEEAEKLLWLALSPKEQE